MVLHCKVTRVFIKKEFFFLKLGQKNWMETWMKFRLNSNKTQIKTQLKPIDEAQMKLVQNVNEIWMKTWTKLGMNS